MTVPTTVDMVRDLLIGADISIFTDEYIQRQIDQGMYAIDIAVMIAESQASMFASKADIKVGSLALSNSQKAQAWMGIKKNLIYRKQTDSGLPNDGSSSAGSGLVGVGAGVVTGSSVQTMQSNVDNPDRVPNQFEVGQFDNPPTNPTGVREHE